LTVVSGIHDEREPFRGRIEVEAVSDPAGAVVVASVFDQVWSVKTMVSPEIIVACLHNGAYASVARLEGVVVGAAFAVVGRALDGARGLNLHSHATGVVPEAAGLGIGESIKRHQWRWARDHDFATITWTFDPLVRRNAWFNLVTLGVRVMGYHVNFYGELNDGINAGEQSDRLLVCWDVDGYVDGAHGAVVEPDPAAVLIDTPPDIALLRKTDAVAAADWRNRQRSAFLSTSAYRVAGLTESYSYVLRKESN
jgi:predicted GNAT superfamily acetyltransferase